MRQAIESCLLLPEDFQFVRTLGGVKVDRICWTSWIDEIGRIGGTGAIGCLGRWARDGI